MILSRLLLCSLFFLVGQKQQRPDSRADPPEVIQKTSTGPNVGHVHVQKTTQRKEGVLTKVNMGAPRCCGRGVGWRASCEGARWALVFWEKDSAHSCTQGGKCKTNMPHTCFLLSCQGSAFKDSDPITHTVPPPPVLTSTVSVGPKLQPLSCRVWGHSQPRKDF